MSAMPLADEPFTAVFASALRGVPCDVIGLGPEPSPLPVAESVSFVREMICVPTCVVPVKAELRRYGALPL